MSKTAEFGKKTQERKLGMRKDLYKPRAILYISPRLAQVVMYNYKKQIKTNVKIGFRMIVLEYLS
jgi:hypothetical protein